MAAKRRPTIAIPVSTGNEIDRWLTEPNLPLDSTPDDIRRYMRDRRTDFPIIMQIARDFQAIPATSSPSERVFSYAGNLITKKRTSIISENVRYVLCLRSWGFLSESDDEVEIVIDENGKRIDAVTLPPTIV